MSNHDFDKLVSAAFGEADEATDKAIQDWLEQDAKAQEMHTQMASLKQGLNSLSDIPECQLTTDRLRDAILSQGVKPAPVRPMWWKWAVPAFTAAVAGAFLLTNNFNAPTASTQVAQNTESGVTSSSAQDEAEETLRELDSLVATNSGSARGAAANVLDQAVQLKNTTEVQSAVVEEYTPRKRSNRRTQTSSPPPSEAVTNVATLVAANLNESASDSALAAPLSFSGDHRSGETTEMRQPDSNEVSFAARLAQPTEKAASAPAEKPEVVVLGGEILPGTRAQGAIETKKDDIVFGG